MHLLDKRLTRALLAALLIHDNSTDRAAIVPATHQPGVHELVYKCIPSRSRGWCTPHSLTAWCTLEGHVSHLTNLKARIGSEAISFKLHVL